MAPCVNFQIKELSKTKDWVILMKLTLGWMMFVRGVLYQLLIRCNSDHPINCSLSFFFSMIIRSDQSIENKRSETSEMKSFVMILKRIWLVQKINTHSFWRNKFTDTCKMYCSQYFVYFPFKNKKNLFTFLEFLLDFGIFIIRVS